MADLSYSPMSPRSRSSDIVWWDKTPGERFGSLDVPEAGNGKAVARWDRPTPVDSANTPIVVDMIVPPNCPSGRRIGVIWIEKNLDDLPMSSPLREITYFVLRSYRQPKACGGFGPANVGGAT